MGSPLEEVLAALLAGGGMPDRGLLYDLSCLEQDDADRLRETWPQLPTELRRTLMWRLVEMAEADFELDFGAAYRVGLDDEDCGVRAAAVEGLWEDEDIRLIAPLAERLRHDEADVVREAAAVSLGRFVLLGELEKIRPEPRSRAYEALLASCADVEETAAVWRRSLESLGYVCNEEVFSLIRRAFSSSDEKCRASAVFAMGRSGDTCWEQMVRGELDSPNPELRFEAARACGELELQEAVAELEILVEDADREVQQAALGALGQIGGDKARLILRRYARSPDEATSAAAAAALEELEFMHGDLDEVFGILRVEGG